MNTAKFINDDKLNITERIKATGNWKNRQVIYAAQCCKHKFLYFGQIGE